MPGSLARFARPLLEFVYPPFCASCDASMSGQDGRICEQCWSSISLLTPDHTLLRQAHARLCSEGLCENVIACYVFEEEGVVQTVIHLLKYAGMTSLGVELGRRLGTTLREQLNGLPIAGIVPVPLHRTKERERGYNQAAFIADGISSVTQIPVCSSLLRRRRFTETQTHLTAEQRRINVAEAFEVPPREHAFVKGRRFLLVDDVLTTGATTSAAARALVASQALPPVVSAVALAR